MKLFDLSGRTALVTGASSGFGAHFAQVLAAAGARVAIGARRVDRLEALAETIRRDGGTALPVALDVTEAESVSAAVAATAEGLGPLTVLVNNAGIAVDRPALEQSEADWDLVLDTDLKGCWLMAQAAAAAMVAQGSGGSIVNIASITGLGGVTRLVGYSTAKGGLINMTRALAVEWARHGIRVNAIAPGYFSTEINAGFLASPAGEVLRKKIPQRRFGALADLDGPLLLLASDAGGHMTGAILPVDGGQTAAI